MSNIDCDAGRCVHNNQGKCNAAVVHIRGGQTIDYNKIHCGTYSYIRPAPHKPDDFLFEAGQDMSPSLEPGQTLRIACNASKCEFFDDYVCNADGIHVRDPEFSSKNSAGCGTFQPV